MDSSQYRWPYYNQVPAGTLQFTNTSSTSLNTGQFIFFVAPGGTPYYTASLQQIGVMSVGCPFSGPPANKGVAIGTNYITGTYIPNNGLIVQGNVGIGTTPPTNSLDVVGNISCSVITASLLGTASIAISASWSPAGISISSSWASQSLSASYSTTSSYSAIALTASYAYSSSVSVVAVATSSFASSSLSSSWASQSLSSSYSSEAGYVVPTFYSTSSTWTVINPHGTLVYKSKDIHGNLRNSIFVAFSGSGTTNDNMTMIVKPVLSTPYTITLGYQPTSISASVYTRFGLAVFGTSSATNTASAVGIGTFYEVPVYGILM